MWCYELENRLTGERTMIIGYNYTDAFDKSNLTINEWICIDSDYID